MNKHIPKDHSKDLQFVIQKHVTARPHYDLRLQAEGVLHSWSVPKGPTLDPMVKRLAMQSPDQVPEYGNFEGVVPEGEQGAGTFMIWDEGTYTVEREIAKGAREEVTDPAEALAVLHDGLTKGEVKFKLHGSRMKGSFALVKTRGFGPKNSWLLIKHKDTYCIIGYDTEAYDRSARSKRTLKSISGSL
jgi:bifunctional non-homologous end joining protein LigD